MSLFDAIKKKSALKNAIDNVGLARENQGEKADALFNKAYQGFEQAIHKDLVISTALYNWGFALLHQAKTKPAEQAVALYQDAITKFSFCLTIDPDYLGAAIDGGVALMDLARLKQASPDDTLYISARRSFEKANSIQKGSASYNLACLYSLCNDDAACLEALQNAKQHGSLPSFDDIVADSDLVNVINKPWFIDFVESLTVIEEPALALENKAPVSEEASVVAAEVESEPQSTETEATPEQEVETASETETVAESVAEATTETENHTAAAENKDAFKSTNF